MGSTLRALGTALGLIGAGCSAVAFGAATDYPSRPIRLVVPYAVGGTTDLVARQYADLLGRELKQTVVVENKPGASTNIGNKLVADADPDGYTLLYSTGQMTQTVTFGPFPAIDPTVSLAPISLILTSPQMIAGNKELAFSTPEALIAAARAEPRRISIASAQLQLYVNVLGSRAGIELLHVPYKGGAPAVTDTIGGRTNLVMAQPPVLLPFIRSGALKPIAVLSQQRIAALPEVRTFAEAGVPELDLITWNGVFAPKGTPLAVIDRVAQATKAALSDPSLARLADDGLTIQSSTPAQLAERVARDMRAWKQLAQEHPDLAQVR
ncbi:MAG TPA: tripartite tricarboxylate transporter substrate-binding protein [Bordetella sp.]|nr:tripartite tricarboxylate transporter substrate-binding protein [Bordetella sp.]